ncbi:MAG TPA: gliding motility-associated C-terminal domain-containing protein, partial [Lacibacter sp.]|nr:gliding motility-associated C-terminal domain-containing protein [Lacibacter sp.]
LFQIIVNPNPTVTVQTPPPACETQPATVTAVPGTPGAYNYFWTVPAGATSPGDVASFSATRPGTYTVQITGTETGCSSPVAAGSVSFLAAQRPVFQALAPLCIGTTLNPLPGQSVNGIAGSWTPAFNNQATTTYLFVPDPAVCAFADSLTLVINPLPTAGLGPGRSICPGEQLVLDPAVTGNNLSYRWQDGSNGPRFTATQPGTYLVTVTNSCGSATSSVLLEEGRCTVFIPSAFTPNNDGLNDRFRVGGAVVLFDFRMEVFNRWGGLVYSSTDPLAGWDGSRKGQPQPAGLYVYRIRYRLPQNDIPEERNGTMLLIR